MYLRQRCHLQGAPGSQHIANMLLARSVAPAVTLARSSADIVLETVVRIL